ncbi:MAG: SDR family NAD(P)-dependent oxidoreductase, partial [Planctomycetes bacterium]|nr:SDR family NAD(P)-dependent oxidoreductase [Planctomycetota bacterium]
MMNLDLSERHIFIAGGSRGIGAATARMAAACGAHVTVSYNANSQAGAQVVSDIEAAGGKAQAVQCQIADRDSVFAAVDKAVDNFGDLQGLVVSAGIGEGIPFEDLR